MSADATFDEAERAMDTEGSDWLGITVDGRFAGWTRADDVRAARTNGTALHDVERFQPIARSSRRARYAPRWN